MQHSIVTIVRQYFVDRVEVLHRAIDPLNKCGMAALAEVVYSLLSLWFKDKGLVIQNPNKPAMEAPASIRVRVVVSLLVKRARCFDIPCPSNSHQFVAGRCWILRVFKDMTSVDIVKRLVPERKRFNCPSNNGTSQYF
jgi:hypothetical protein